MLSYCFKYKKKIQETKTQEFKKLTMVEQCDHQNVPYVVIKNQDLQNNNKQKEY